MTARNNRASAWASRRTAYYNRMARVYWQYYLNTKRDHNILKEMCQNSQGIKERAKEIYNRLESQYKDRIRISKNQEGLHNYQHHALTETRNSIINNAKTLEDQREQIMTRNRQVAYAYEDADYKSKVNHKLRYGFLAMSMCVVVLIIIQMRQKK